MKRMLQFKKAMGQEQLGQRIQAELTKQMQLVGTLSAECQTRTLNQLLECQPLLLASAPRQVRGWQDNEHHGASVSLTFRSNYQLILTVFCPPNDAPVWYPDAKIFIYRGSQLATYLACHHSQLCAALHRSLQVMSQPQPAPASK